MGFNRDTHIGHPEGLDYFGSLSSTSSMGRLNWLPNVNIVFSDNTVYTNGVVTAIGGINNNFTDKNTWTTETVDSNGGWSLKFYMPALGPNTAIAFGAAQSSKNANNFDDIDECFYFNGVVAGDLYVYQNGAIKISQSGVPDMAEIEIRKPAGSQFVEYYTDSSIPFYTSLIPVVATDYKIKISVFQTAGTVSVKSFMNI